MAKCFTFILALWMEFLLLSMPETKAFLVYQQQGANPGASSVYQQPGGESLVYQQQRANPGASSMYQQQGKESSMYQQRANPGASSVYQQQGGESSVYQQRTNPGASSVYQQRANPGASSVYQKQGGESSVYQQRTNPGASSVYQQRANPGASLVYQQRANPGASSVYQQRANHGASLVYQHRANPGASSVYQQQLEKMINGALLDYQQQPTNRAREFSAYQQQQRNRAFLAYQQQIRETTSAAVTGVLNAVVDNLVNEALQTASSIVCNRTRDRLQQFSSRAMFTVNPGADMELVVNEDETVTLNELFLINAGSLPTIPLESVSFDCSSYEVSIITRPYGNQVIIPNIMVLRNIALTLSVTVTDAQTLVISFSGQWIIGGITLDIHVEYTRESGDYAITAMPSGTNVDFVSFANGLTGLTLPNPFSGSLSFDSFVLSGLIKADGNSTLTISQTLHDPKIYIIVHKRRGRATQKAIAAEFSNFGFSSLISQVTGLDLSGVPYFGLLTAPSIGLTISSADINNLPAGIFSASTLLHLNGNAVENGIVAYLNFDFLSNPVKMTYTNVLTFIPPINGLRVNRLFSAIPNVNLDSIPDIDDIFNVDIVNFTLSNVPERAMTVSLRQTGDLRFFSGFIIINDAYITLYLSSQPIGVRAEVAGVMNIGQNSFTASLLLDDEDNYVLQASSDVLPISSVLSQFHADVLPSEFQSVLSNVPFVSFSIADPILSYPIAAMPQTIHISGTPEIGGYSTIYMDAILLRQGSRTILVEGFEVGSVNLADILHTVTGFSFRNVALLNQELDIAILISPVTLPNIQLSGQRLRDIVITRGLSVQAQMSFPSDCSTDAFCAVAQSLLGADARLMLQGAFTSNTRFSAFAGVADINVGNGLTIGSAGLEVQAGAETSVGLRGSIVLSDPPITLTSRIFLSISGVVLEMSQSGCWNNAFGANWLGICNILGSVGMIPGVLLTSLEVGGEIRLGDASCSTPIAAAGFLGVDAINPSNNYYYVEITGSATIASLLSAFCVNINLPRPLSESGFPNGFLSSFSLFGQEIAHASISIPQGFRIRGTLNILGLEGTGDMTINFPNGFDMSVELPPINIGNGLFRMFASSSDTSRGPFLRTDINILPSPSVNISASGYVNVLGISAEATLRITNTNYEISLSGRMLSLFEASLFISASYGSISQLSFQVRGSFRNDMYAQIERRIRETLQSSANEATSAISRAQDAVNRQQAHFESANRDLQSAQRDVESARGAFNTANQQLQSARDQVNSVCRIRHCDSVCSPCIRGTECCGSIIGQCVCWRPRFDSCCHRITDPSCEAANHACNGLRETARAVLRAAEETVNGARQSLDAAEAALVAAQDIVNAARSSLDAAVGVLEAASQTYRAGSLAAQKIAEVGVNGLISIREISFDVSLSAASGGSFAGSVRVSFLGQTEVSVGLSINMQDITAMARQLADRVGNGLSSLF